VAGAITPLLVGIIVAAALVGLLIGLRTALSRLAPAACPDGPRRYPHHLRRARVASHRQQNLALDRGQSRLLSRPVCRRRRNGSWPIIYFVRSVPAGAQRPGAAFFGGVALLILTIFCVILVFVLATWALRDFVLPFILFEDAPFGDALARAASLIRDEPGPVLFYFFMKFVFSLVAGIGAELCIALVAFVAAIPTGLVAFILWLALHHAGTLGTIFMYVGFGLLGALFLIALLAAIICVGGATLIFYQAYALYFLGGRIPQIGNLLEPPPQPYYPPMPAPPFTPA